MVVERSLALLKNRFRKLKTSMLKQKIEDVPVVVVAACVLHNTCLMNEDDIDDSLDEGENGHYNGEQPAENNFNGFVVLPYVQGVSEKIGRTLNQQKVKVAYKPQLTISSLFPRPKELDDSDRQKSGIVYKISCTQCNFVYYGQTERSLKTRIV